LRSPSLKALLIADWSKSAAKTKIRGDKGSPCLTPILQKNYLLGTPFRRTADLPKEKN
jgi:hypothetical protein